MLLIPGLQGQQDQAFREAGVTVPLAASGWTDGGYLIPSTRGAEFERDLQARERVFYALIMPTDRPIAAQAEWLNTYLDAVIRRHREQPIILVAHSIAGVVARYALVTRTRPEVNALVTIATPHLDAGMLQLSDLFWQSPLSTLTPLVADGELKRLLELFIGFSSGQPGNVLGWLGHQTHPDIRYVSIVRLADTLVEPTLQDLGRLPELRGRVETLYSPGGHALAPTDGTLLAALFSTAFSSTFSTTQAGSLRR